MSKYWPERIGPLELQRSVASMLAIYADPESGERYAAGCERGGRRRRGWWFKEVDESKRGDGYRDFSPRTRDEAISELRTAAGIAGQARLDEYVERQRELMGYDILNRVRARGTNGASTEAPAVVPEPCVFRGKRPLRDIPIRR